MHLSPALVSIPMFALPLFTGAAPIPQPDNGGNGGDSYSGAGGNAAGGNVSSPQCDQNGFDLIGLGFLNGNGGNGGSANSGASIAGNGGNGYVHRVRAFNGLLTLSSVAHLTVAMVSVDRLSNSRTTTTPNKGTTTTTMTTIPTPMETQTTLSTPLARTSSLMARTTRVVEAEATEATLHPT